MEAGLRLKKIREHFKIANQSDFARKLGVERSKIADIESGRTVKIPIEMVIDIVDKFHINGWWLFTGKGSMFENQNNDINGYEVEVLDLKASAGTGIIPFEVNVIGKYIIDKLFFSTPQKQDNIKILQVEGDSMEPTIQDGSFIVIDITKNEKIDGIYAILLDNNVFIKRLQFNLDGTIKIISDNEKYEAKLYDPKESQVFFKILGRKVLTIQR